MELTNNPGEKGIQSGKLSYCGGLIPYIASSKFRFFINFSSYSHIETDPHYPHSKVRWRDAIVIMSVCLSNAKTNCALAQGHISHNIGSICGKVQFLYDDLD